MQCRESHNTYKASVNQGQKDACDEIPFVFNDASLQTERLFRLGFRHTGQELFCTKHLLRFNLFFMIHQGDARIMFFFAT